MRLMLGSLALTLTCTTLISVYVARTQIRLLKDDANVLLTEAAQDLAHSADTELAAEKRFIRTISATGVFSRALVEVNRGRLNNAEVTGARAHIRTILKGLDGRYQSLWLVDADGNVITGNGELLSPKDAASFQTAGTNWKKVASSEYPQLGEVQISPETGKPVVTVATSILSPQGKPIGMIGGTLNLSFLEATTAAKELGESGYGFIIDHEGRFIYHPSEELDLSVNMASLPGVEDIAGEMTSGHEGMLSYNYHGTGKFGAYAPLHEEPWSVAYAMDEAEVMAPVAALVKVLITGTVVMVLIACAVALFLSARLTRPILAASRGMRTCYANLAAAATQVGATSQMLADSSATQAASLEETSSSMEELASIAKTNEQGADLTYQRVNQAEEKLQHMVSASRELEDVMNEMAEFGAETGRIMQTIGEIAFQTNILALNAAVEAARAGEAGSGFAVVADEVRRLAQRAAEASESTSGILEKSNEKIKRGKQTSDSIVRSFGDLTQTMQEVNRVAQDISNGCRQQSQGFSHVNTAVQEIDSSVQENAAGAQENASASQHLEAQARDLRDWVKSLEKVVNGQEIAAEQPQKQAPKRKDYMPENRETERAPYSGAARYAEEELSFDRGDEEETSFRRDGRHQPQEDDASHERHSRAGVNGYAHHKHNVN